MGFFNEYPYTNLHEANLDFIIKKVTELDNKVNKILEQKIDEYIEKMFNKIMIDATYDEETETIIMKKEIVSDGCFHVYSGDNNTMSIM